MQSDSYVGYVSRSDAPAAGCAAPFTQAQEDMLNDYYIFRYTVDPMRNNP
jgi:hypothetical protein